MSEKTVSSTKFDLPGNEWSRLTIWQLTVNNPVCMLNYRYVAGQELSHTNETPEMGE